MRWGAPLRSTPLTVSGRCAAVLEHRPLANVQGMPEGKKRGTINELTQRTSNNIHWAGASSQALCARKPTNPHYTVR